MPRRTLVRATGLITGSVMTLSGLSVVAAAPAQAAGPSSGSVSTTNGVLYDDCKYHQFRYSVSPGAAVDDWDLEISARDARGVEQASGYLYGSNAVNRTTTGGDGLLFCGGERTGTYRLEATLTTYDYDADSNWMRTKKLPTDYFTMRAPRTKTTMRVSDKTPKHRQRVRLRVNSKAEYPRGYFGNDYATVLIQKKQGTRWVRFRKTYANDRGAATVQFRWPKKRGPMRLRAVTTRETPHTASASRAVRLRTVR